MPTHRPYCPQQLFLADISRQGSLPFWLCGTRVRRAGHRSCLVHLGIRWNPNLTYKLRYTFPEQLALYIQGQACAQGKPTDNPRLCGSSLDLQHSLVSFNSLSRGTLDIERKHFYSPNRLTPSIKIKLNRLIFYRFVFPSTSFSNRWDIPLKPNRWGQKKNLLSL